jgi:hypothetical protein
MSNFFGISIMTIHYVWTQQSSGLLRPYSLAQYINILENVCFLGLLFDFEEGGNTFLQNINGLLLHYTATT